MDRVLPPYPPDRSASAQAPARAARRDRPHEDPGHRHRRATGVRVAGRDGAEETIPARTVLWAAGVLAVVVRADRGRRRPAPRPTGPAGSLVEPDLTIPGHPEIFVVGDAAVRAVEAGPADARASRRARSRAGRTPPRSSAAGSSAGRTSRSTTATTATWRSSAGWRGSPTSPGSARSADRAASRPGPLWLGIHIFYLIGFSNRIVVLMRWAWTFLTHGRGDAAHHRDGRCCRRSRSPSRRSSRRSSRTPRRRGVANRRSCPAASRRRPARSVEDDHLAQAVAGAQPIERALQIVEPDAPSMSRSTGSRPARWSAA